MPLITDVLPAEVQKSHAELEAALAGHRDLQRRVAEATAALPVANRTVEAARAAWDAAEINRALATDETDKPLTRASEAARREFEAAEEGARRVQLLARGLASRIETAADALISARTSFETACHPFCDQVLAGYRDLYRASLFGADGLAGMPFIRVLRLGHAIAAALPFSRTLRAELREVLIPDIGPVPGRPVPRFVQGDRVWLDDDQVAGGTLGQWADDPEIVALHALLKSLGAEYAAATMQVRRIEAERWNAPPREVPKAAELPPQPPRMTAEEFIASQPTAEEHRALMQEQRKAATEQVVPPAPYTYSEGNRFQGQRLA